MKNSKVRKNSYTIDISNLKKHNTRNNYSKSYKSLKLKPKELFNDNVTPSEYSQLNNSFTKSLNYQNKEIKYKNYLDNDNSQLNNLEGDEINYDIETTNKNNHDTTDSSQSKVENEYKLGNGKINGFNFYEDNLNKNIVQNDYWMEEKNKYIQQLEKKIHSQENSINNLIQYNNIIEEKCPVNKNNLFNFASLENDLNYDFSNKKLVKKLSKEDIITNRLNCKFNNQINLKKEEEKNSQDKYNLLYSKYLQLNNDFKYLNNNKSHYLKEINKFKIKYERLQKGYNILKNKYDSKNNIIDSQRKEIKQLKKKINSNYKIQYIVGGKEEKEIIKNLKQQVEVFRKDLVLSQIMVSSLKSEIEQLTKNNNSDKYNVTFNTNKNRSITPISQSNNTINFKDLYYNRIEESPQHLINSINNKNQLLTKVLEENNHLRNKLKKYDSCSSYEFMIDDFNAKKEEKIYQKVITKYEDKFKYFNDYISKIKTNIQKIYEEIPLIFNKYSDKIENNILSDKFILELYNIKKNYNNIKRVDLYNLDITDDENCINILINLTKILNEELENVKEKISLENKKAPEILNDDIKSNKIELNTNKINYNDLNINKINYNDLNINKISDTHKHTYNMLNKNENEKKYENNILKNNNNSNKITLIHNFKDEIQVSTVHNTNKNNKNGIYNFVYGKNANDKFLENDFKDIINNNVEN